MGWKRDICILIVCFINMTSLSLALTIDEMITNAAESPEEFAFFQGTEENPTIKVELDMIFTPKQWAEIMKAREDGGRTKRKAIKSDHYDYRWTNKIIPFEISSSFSAKEREEVLKALDEWEQYTCLNIRPATGSDVNKVLFTNGGGCYSSIGMTGGTQIVGLASACRHKTIIVHEVGHAVGFQHEQTRPDRDAYVRIIRQNIPPNLYYNFDKYTSATVNSYGVAYDYHSIMHYGQRSFTVNGGLTIETVDPAYQSVIGSGDGLSFKDIKLANIMYSCAANCKTTKCPGEGFLDKNCKCMCPGDPIKACTGTETGTGTGTGTGGHCVNMHQTCDYWSSIGECQKNPFYMMRYCTKACKLCGDEVTRQCPDMNMNCTYWGAVGYCTDPKYVPYMRGNCPKTCNTCPAQMAATDPQYAVNSNAESARQTQSAGRSLRSQAAVSLAIISLWLAFFLSS